MTKALYLDDSYQKEFEAEVVSVNDKYAVLDKTLFYPESGGQPTDTGVLIKDDEEYNVVYAKKIKGDISHEVDKTGLKAGDKVKGIIDWDRRYLLMRYHTAAHVLSTVVHNATGCVITGNQLNIDKGRIDFDLEEFNRDELSAYARQANEIIKKGLSVEIKMMPREEAFKIPSLVRITKMLPESIKKIRVVDIEGFDKQACAGTHVRNLSEIGEIEIIKAENKGKNNRRLYFKLKD